MASRKVDYEDPDIWEKLDPAHQQVHLLQRIAEDTKDIRSMVHTWWIVFWIALGLAVVLALGTASQS